MIPKTNIGIANAEILIFNPNAATSQAVAVVPIFAPKTNPNPPDKLIKPALINEIVITETRELDWIKAVTVAPTVILLYNLFVAFFSKFWRGPLVKTLKPSSNIIIPKSRIAIPAEIVLKFGLKKRTIANAIKNNAKMSRLIISKELFFVLKKSVLNCLNVNLHQNIKTKKPSYMKAFYKI